MTLNDWLREQDGRCPRCLMHETAQGHRSVDSEGVRTGCRDEGPASAAIVALREAEARRDAGMARTMAAHPDATSLIMATIKRHAATGRPFSANTIRAELSSLKPSERPSIGACMNASRGLLRKVDEVPSTDPGTHGKPVSVWVGKQAA